MMNQGGNTGTVASLDPTALHNHQSADSARQLYTPAYYPSASGPEAATWAMHKTDNNSTENGMTLNSNYHYAQHTDSYSRVQDGSNTASLGSSSLGQPIAPQEYNGYASYPTSTDQYSYGNTNTSTNSGYQSYYQGYQQQSTTPSYSQPTGSYQNSGAPYQPISSFQNTTSYAGSKDYSRTYYNPGDYQTSGAYPSSGYNNQTTSWSGGNYANYTSQPYTNNAPDSSGAYSSSSTAATTSAQYHQQWADYYSQTEVSCAPGTENMPATSTSNLGRPVSDATNGYLTSVSQPPQSFTPSESPSMQPDAVTSGSHDNYWKHGAPAFQNNHATPQVDYQNHVDANNSYNSSAQQMNSCSQGPNSQYPHGFGTSQQMNSYSQGSNSQYPHGSGTAHQMNSCPQGSNSQYPRGFGTAQQISSSPQGINSQYQPAPQLPLSYSAALQTVPPADTHSVSKLQIPTNPRIAPNLGLRAPKINKDNFTPNVAVKPAYIGVSIPKPQEKPHSLDAADSLLKPVTFPTSLRGYVERALARCKDDVQIAACQAVMKEVITKATSDGTLNTKDWDTEPLFPVPNAEVTDKSSMFTTVIASLSKQKRSPSRKLKSRWEPLPEEKSVDKPTPISHVTYKFNGWFSSNERAKTDSSEAKEEFSSSLKFPVEQKSANKKAPMPFKRQRVDDVSNAAENGEASSDSDKEQSLAAYYPAAISLANSAEERKRRENRSKRFDKGQRHRAESNNFKQKNSGAGNLYSRRATAMVISKSFEDGANMAVEDIDWNALTVKGTCQEIEKRYLRLTSAPDPATVRPEEVLEKALTMVQNSQKNYLYKCDQLKSIRQDLTVQHIRNELTVKVYETHARLAVEVGDVPEYNQCQSQLKSLYAEGVEGSHMEFYAYNLLCVILHSSNYRELLSSMSRLSDEAKNDEAVKHALAVRAAVTSGNYVSFFRLYKKAPNLNTCLMDLYVEKIRYEAVKCMSRSYRPTIPVAYIAQVLGFTNVLNTTEGGEEDGGDLEECVEWLKAHGACLIPEANGELQLDTKASTSNLYMPEPDDAVAHGDANLAVNDFLTRTS